MDTASLRDLNICIYGTGGNGISLYRRIPEGYNFVCFIDKRADDIKELSEKPVVSVDSLSKFTDLDKTVVFITIKSVFSHSDIARDLIKCGIRYIIFKPDNVLKDVADETELRINEIYEALIEGNGEFDDISIPHIDVLPVRLRNRLLIKEEGQEVTTWCPVELLFNYPESEDYPGINMPLFFPLVELYRSFLGDPTIDGEESEMNFIDYCCEWLRKNDKPLTLSQTESFLESRGQIFSDLQKMTEVDIDYFKSNCPSVKYVSGRFFLTSSGRNRVAFLIAKGFKYVPIRMSKVDYDIWCDVELVSSEEKRIEQGELRSYYAPATNPFLVDVQTVFADYMRLFVIPSANHIIKGIYNESKYAYVNMDSDSRGRCVDQKKVDKLLSDTVVVCQINDEGRAAKYFKSLGIDAIEGSVKTSDIENKRNAYLIIDENNIEKVDDLYNTACWKGIFYIRKTASKELRFDGYGCYRTLFEHASTKTGCVTGIVALP